MTATLTAPALRHRRARTEQPLRSFRPDIEALRAIAVVIVVLFHAGVSWLPGGFVGVDVFFVVSGFLITTHLFGEFSRTGRVRLGRFYARRARRLLPAASLVAIVSVLGVWAFASGLKAADTAGDALWSSAFAMNIQLALTGVDYQANQDPSLLQHFWSLSVEEQFYLVWPLLMLVTGTLAVRRFGMQHARVAIGAVIATICLASFAYCTWLMSTAPTMAYFLSPARTWELGLGALIAITAPFLARYRFLASGWWCAAGLAAIMLSAVWYTEETPFPGVTALLPTLGVAVVIISGLTKATGVERAALSHKPIQGLGRLSYGWYLWHWPLLLLVPSVLDRSTSVVENLVVSGIALVLAMWTYIALEDPVRAFPALARSTWRSLTAGVATLAATLVVALTVMTLGPNAYLTGDYASEVEPSDVTAAVIDSAALEVVPGNLDPSLEEISKDKPDLQAPDGISCMVGLRTSTLSEDEGGSCIAGGTQNGTTTVMLVGDSHAYQWMPALREVAIERDWKLISLTKSGCTLNDVELVNSQLKRDYTECYDWREAVWERIEQEQPDLIITSAAIFSERDGDFTERWIEGVETTTQRMVATGAPVVVIADTPYPKVDVPTCLAENVRAVTECVLDPEEAYSDPERRLGTVEAAEEAGAMVIDPRSWFCSESACPVIVGNQPVYSDNSHVTATYSRTLATVLSNEIPTDLGGSS